MVAGIQRAVDLQREHEPARTAGDVAERVAHRHRKVRLLHQTRDANPEARSGLRRDRRESHPDQAVATPHDDVHARPGAESSDDARDVARIQDAATGDADERIADVETAANLRTVHDLANDDALRGIADSKTRGALGDERRDALTLRHRVDQETIVLARALAFGHERPLRKDRKSVV